jgi:hypothetical protein
MVYLWLVTPCELTFLTNVPTSSSWLEWSELRNVADHLQVYKASQTGRRADIFVCFQWGVNESEQGRVVGWRQSGHSGDLCTRARMLHSVVCRWLRCHSDLCSVLSRCNALIGCYCCSGVLRLLRRLKEPRSSVSIVSDYGLDDRAIGVRSPAEDISSNLCVQTSSEAHPASCTMDNGGPFPGAKRGRGVTLTTHTI